MERGQDAAFCHISGESRLISRNGCMEAGDVVLSAAKGAVYRDVFVIFTSEGLLFSSFAPESTDGAYDYFYGAGVKG